MWEADHSFNTGRSSVFTVSIAGTNYEPLFQSERWDDSPAPELQYSLPIQNGGHQVNLYFADIYSGTQSVGARVFDVLIEGLLVFDNVDIFAEAGGYTALIKSMNVSVTDGVLNIEFRHGVENPKISAIEVVSLLPPAHQAPSVAADAARELSGAPCGSSVCIMPKAQLMFRQEAGSLFCYCEPNRRLIGPARFPFIEFYRNLCGSLVWTFFSYCQN